ncbi:MAG: NUDIX domain-containing protein [Bacteroidota bacterium]
MNTYRLNPNVSVDCVIFGFDGEKLNILLIDRKAQGILGQSPAIPGDLIRESEDLDRAAERILRELTGLEKIFLEQFHSFGKPDRISKNKDIEWLKTVRAEPDARVITVAYYSLIRSDSYEIAASSFAKRAYWKPIDQIPELSFDHNEIIDEALKNLKFRIKYQPIGFELLPEKFTMRQLQRIYEAILGIKLDKRNFRRKILKMKFLIPSNEKQIGVPHKPAQFYTFDKHIYNEVKESDFYFKL